MPKSNKGKRVSQSEGHSHGHGGSCTHDHGHSHSHAGGQHEHAGHDHGGHSHAHGGSHDHNEHDHGHSHGHGGAGHDHDHDHDHGHSHSHGHGSCSHDHSQDNQPFVDPILELTQRLETTKVTTHQTIEEINSAVGTKGTNGEKIEYSSYTGEEQLEDIMALIEKDLSEPYSIFTYRYFIGDWPQLCVIAKIEEKIIGVVVCKLDTRQRGATRLRGYIAMLAVDQSQRKLGIGSRLVREAIYKMMLEGADEVVLETELSNKGALALYETLGFIRDKRLHKYYLNGGDAFRLVLPLTPQFLAIAP